MKITNLFQLLIPVYCAAGLALPGAGSASSRHFLPELSTNQLVASNISGVATSVMAVRQGTSSILFSTDSILSASTNYEDQDIIVSNATVIIDGEHRLKSLRVTTNGVITCSLGQTNL